MLHLLLKKDKDLKYDVKGYSDFTTMDACGGGSCKLVCSSNCGYNCVGMCKGGCGDVCSSSCSGSCGGRCTSVATHA